MDYAVVSVAAAAVRRKPDHRKEMVSQLLFGETVKVLKTRKEIWCKVRSLHDDYEGWTTNTLLSEVDEQYANTINDFAVTGREAVIGLGEKKIYVPAGASLPFFEGGKGKLGEQTYHFGGQCIKRTEQQPGATLLKELIQDWVNAPYLWGGRTMLGVDCSGLVQVIYKQMGIDLTRDAWQQAQEGKPVKKFSEVQAGDLAFFDNKEDIVHTGILLGDGTIIHASGKVRIDAIDKKGIINTDTGKRMLRLKAIRRVWPV
ncbi:MAG: C40 family peptidase [Chitinophagaceae bacterium]